jgi:clan AA aspartic protease
MISGMITASREALVRVRVRGSQEIEVDAVLDTGFTEYLSLPPSLIALLALPYVTLDRVMLADGSIVRSRVYEARVVWEGQERIVSAHATQGTPLIGMSLLYDHLLTMEVVDGGAVTIEPLP